MWISWWCHAEWSKAHKRGEQSSNIGDARSMDLKWHRGLQNSSYPASLWELAVMMSHYTMWLYRTGISTVFNTDWGDKPNIIIVWCGWKSNINMACMKAIISEQYTHSTMKHFTYCTLNYFFDSNYCLTCCLGSIRLITSSFILMYHFSIFQYSLIHHLACLECLGLFRYKNRLSRYFHRRISFFQLQRTRRFVRSANTLLLVSYIMEVMTVASSGDEQSAAVERTAFFSPQMRRGGEQLWQALVRSWIWIKYFWAPSLTLVHDAGVFELLNESFFSSVEKLSVSWWNKEESQRRHTDNLHNSFAAPFHLRTYSCRPAHILVGVNTIK